MCFAEFLCVIFPSSHNEWEERHCIWRCILVKIWKKKRRRKMRCWLNAKSELCENFSSPLLIIVNNHGLNQLLCENVHIFTSNSNESPNRWIIMIFTKFWYWNLWWSWSLCYQVITKYFSYVFLHLSPSDYHTYILGSITVITISK